jgi:diacylglycerol kinase family enzyme
MSARPALAAARRPSIDGARAAVHIVVNLRAGAADETARAQIAAHPALAGRPLRWHVPRRARELPQVALAAARTAQRNGGVVVAAGGDGTINAVAQAAWSLGVPLGVLAHGTFNFFGREHGLAEDTAQAIDEFAQALQRAQLRPVRVGLVNERVFLVNASLGLYPRLLAEREAATRRFGRHRLVVMLAGVASLLQPAGVQRLHVVDRSVGGVQSRHDLEVSTLFVGANALQLEQVGLPEADEVARGALAALMLAPQTRWQTLRMVWRALRGRLGDEQALHSLACTRLDVSAAGWRPSARVKVAFDGETAWMRLPLHFAVGEKPLWLVAPPHVVRAHDPAAAQPPAALTGAASAAVA